MDGAACLAAALAAVQSSGMGPPHVDMAGALAIATASGVAPEIAAELLPACAAGIAEGLAERRREA